MSICESNNGGNLPLTWAHTRNMPITLGVGTSDHRWPHTFINHIPRQLIDFISVYMNDSGNIRELEDGKYHIVYL